MMDSDADTEPLPSAKELAAFAKNPDQARRLLDKQKRKKRARQDKSNAPIQPMRPSRDGRPASSSDAGAPPSDARRLQRLLEINKAINTETDLGSLLDRIMDAAVELSSARRGFLVLWTKGEMQVVRARNMEKKDIASPESAISRHLIREAIDRRETVITARASTERDEYASATGLDLKSVMVSPLVNRGRILGALYLDEPDRVGVFDEEDVSTLEAFCDTAAIALLNARQVEELKTRMESQRLRLRRVQIEMRRRDEEDVRRFGNLVTHSPKLKRVFDLLARVAETSFPVIVQGESGTGKELLAKAIHYSSLRREEPFVPMNCAAVPETLLDSELFGYQAGAFTGAVRGHKGLFEQADKGTLFLDEIEEMSPAMQGKLLRVLQEGEVRRVGGKATVKVDVRVIAATNKDMQEMVEQGAFRRDLYYRLNVIPVTIPPLRERMEDLEALIQDLLVRVAGAGDEAPQVDPDAMEAMKRFDWPGNVRELENELKRLVALGVTQVRRADLKPEIQHPDRKRRTTSSDDLPTLNIKELEKITIERALKSCNGNKTHAAKMLGLSRRGLLKKLERYRADGVEIDLGDD
jgi:transcriptional regulator with GAF, ATPase, and Fis domain